MNRLEWSDFKETWRNRVKYGVLSLAAGIVFAYSINSDIKMQNRDMAYTSFVNPLCKKVMGKYDKNEDGIIEPEECKKLLKDLNFKNKEGLLAGTPVVARLRPIGGIDKDENDDVLLEVASYVGGVNYETSYMRVPPSKLMDILAQKDSSEARH